MKFNLTDLFLKSFNKDKDRRNKAIEEGKLTSINPKKDAKIDKIIQDVLTNGIPFTEFDWVLDAIVYLYFDGIIHESETVIIELHEEIVTGAFDKKVISKINELQSYPIEIGKDASIYSTKEYIPYYLLQKKAGDFTSKWIDKARDWVKKHQNIESCIWNQNGHYTWSVWLEGEETPLHEKPEWKKIIEENEINYLKAKRRRESSVFGGRPKEILTPFKPDLQESFSWWSSQLNYLLTPKYRATEFKDNKDYEEVALEIGERCLKLMPQAKENLHQIEIFTGYQADQANEDIKNRAFNENRGLVKYVNLLSTLGNLKQALYVCEECIKYGVHDGTKTGFRGRAEIIKNKIDQQNPKPLNKRGKKGTLNDEQILELVAKYLSSSSEDRQLLPLEYGITRSNLYYLVSKNKHLL